MSRLIALAVAGVLAPAIAQADDVPAAPTDTVPAPTPEPATAPEAVPASAPAPPPDAPMPAEVANGETLTVKAGAHPEDLSDQAIGAAIGVATGGRDTAGGLRVSGNWLYQLSDQDWFDGTVAFTFGGSSAACFRDRMDTFLCDHGLADGSAFELGFNVRRFIGGNGKYWPFARAGFGVEYVRFGDDDVSGIAIPLHLGGGLRVSVASAIAITAIAQLELGLARFNHTLGVEPQAGVTIGAGVEFNL